MSSAKAAEVRDMKERTEPDLVVACLEGDRSAFPELVERYQIQIFNVAYRITGNRADAQDAAQAAFLKVFERLDQFDPTTVPVVDTTLSAEERTPGGLGVFIVRSQMDDVVYSHENGNLSVSFTKYRELADD